MAAAGVHILISYPEKDKVSGDVFISESLIDDMGSMLQGAEIVLITSAFSETDEMHTYLSALAIQNQFYILSTNDVREEAPHRGTSCVVDQYGKVIDTLDDKEGMLYYNIDLNDNNRRDTAPHMTDLNKETFRMMVEMGYAGAKMTRFESTSGAATEEMSTGEAKKYIKKPIPVEAYQTDKEMTIQTLEGDMAAMPGDYIVTGIKGEQYPVKREIFEEMYAEIK